MLDTFGQGHLLFLGEQAMAADGTQIEAYQIGVLRRRNSSRLRGAGLEVEIVPQFA